ncbi:MAG: lysylphosphatidylglycerol synthase domain-containing protein [Dehalococcoidia bacterium]
MNRLLAWLVLPLALAVSIFLLLRFYEMPRVEDASPLGIALIVLLTALLVVGSVAAAYCILAGADGHLSFGRLYLAVTASAAANCWTPVRAGIPLRVYLYRRLMGMSLGTGSALMGLEMVLVTLVPAALALFGLVLFLPAGGLVVPAVVAAGASLAIPAIAFVRGKAYDRVVGRLPLPRIARKMLAPESDIVAALRGVPLWSMAAAAAIYAGMFVLVGVRSFYAFQIFGGSMNVLELVAISAAAFTLGSLSLLPMGLGVRDATLVALCVQAGADRDIAIAVAALDRLLSTGIPLLLGIISAHMLGLRTVGGPKDAKLQTATVDNPERTGTSRHQADVRLGSYYRWVLTTALWPAERATGRILDVGCHSGFWLHQQTGRNGARVGCDLEPVPLYSDVQYVKCDARKLPLATGSFDLCTAWDVLEHVPDDAAMLRELSRVLRPGGHVRLSVPHKQIAVFPAFLTPWLHRHWQHSVRSGYTPSGIQSLAMANGFAECRVLPLKATWFRALYLIASLLWRIWQPAGRRLVAALAVRDARAGWGSKGVLLVELEKR